QAARNNQHPQVMQRLVASGANFAAKTNDGDFPGDLAVKYNQSMVPGISEEYRQLQAKLFLGANQGNLQMIQEALVQGAYIQAIDKTFHNFTPLHWAAMNGHTDAVDLLLRHGANTNARDA